MIHIPVLRWGEPYKSLDIDKITHFATGEAVAEVSRANGGLLERDMKKAPLAREALREIPIRELLKMVKKAGELYAKAELPLGDGVQTPDDFARMQSATTGLPEHMCKFNMEKNEFFHAVALGEDVEIEPAGERVEDLVHVAQHEVVLLHVELAHVLGQAGGGRLHPGELVGRLGPVAQRQLGLGVQLAGLLHHLEQVADGDLAENVAGPLGVAHVALDQGRVGPPDLSQHLAGGEVDDLVRLQALVRLAPTEHGDADHVTVPLVGVVR